jgi:hypothetical protein
MIELIRWLLTTHLTVQAAILTTLVSFLMLRKLSGTDLFVAVTVWLYAVVEITGAIMSYKDINNLWFYNTMLFPQFLLVSATLNREMKGVRLRQVYNTGGLLLMIAHLVNLLLYQGVHDFANFTFIPACAWMAGGCFFFLREQMELSDDSPFNRLIAWFALATLIDNAGSMPILSILGWTTYIETDYAGHLWDVVVWLFAGWFLLILFGLLWTKTSLRSALSSR